MEDNFFGDEPLRMKDGLSDEESLQALIEYAKKYPSLQKYVQTFTPEEMGSLIFIGNGPDITIQGMHYPDEALDLDSIPNIFPGAEEGTIIAAFPDSLLKTFTDLVIQKIDEEYQDAFWEKLVGAMLESVLDIMDGEIPNLDLDKLL